MEASYFKTMNNNRKIVNDNQKKQKNFEIFIFLFKSLVSSNVFHLFFKPPIFIFIFSKTKHCGLCACQKQKHMNRIKLSDHH